MAEPQPRIAVYTGSFDPVTLGHVNVIERASRLVDKLIVGVGVNPEKGSLFTTQERVDLIEQSVKHMSNIEVQTFSGLAVDFVRAVNSRVMIRGVRPLTDIAAEFTMLMANRQLDPEVETIFLMADEEFTHISSTLLKQITPLASDEKLARFVPRVVIKLLREKLAEA